ncbi:MAG: excinuclease ABC subunit A [Bacteroidetes bacterium]|nr:MAG: excinuclease ABC subunit A [Bacteroidota bacterium]PIE87550.1 MAG: excinuclease ABC subunit A [Bacteroidota bacterium]
MKEALDITTYDSREYILIKGAKIHNLKNIDVAIPRNKLVVITGLSGSGKSSLAFDTLYAEGQRRYVESLSAYARQFLGRMPKPEVDAIKGIAPAIAIAQKVNTRNPRSTVGTSTEIYEYLKLLFARIGKTHSPISGKEVKKHTVSDITTHIEGLPPGTKGIITCPILFPEGRSPAAHLDILIQQGYSRVVINNRIHPMEEALSKEGEVTEEALQLLIDRFIVPSHNDPDFSSRIADSAQTAFLEGDGTCHVLLLQEKGVEQKNFSNRFELDHLHFEEPSPNFFSFNNPYGACKNCEGMGSVIGIDPDKVIPNRNLSVYEGAIACWKGEKMGAWKERLIREAHHFNFPIHKPIHELSKEEYSLLWTGNQFFKGLDNFFQHIEEQTYKIQYRVMLSRYRGKTTCPECQGSRLRKDAGYVTINGLSITDLVLMPISHCLTFFSHLTLNEYEKRVSDRLVKEITNRLAVLMDVGLGYLTLNRLSSTLSGGEAQRINLATSLGSSLVGSMYILDEPSIGLHPRDSERLISVLQRLRDIGNTVIVVEHDEAFIRAADEIIDIGPLAGSNGGELVFQGSFKALKKEANTLTANYIRNESLIPVPKIRRKWNDFITIKGAREHNLKNIEVRIPLACLTAVTGVSGSGKTTLIKHILYPALKNIYGGASGKTGTHDLISGDIEQIHDIEMIDQNPIGRSSRSNPATYLKAFDDIRNLFAAQKLAKIRGYKPGFFSFNVQGGRCDECEGEGIVHIEMQFMADIALTCESCKGKRYKSEVLDILYRGKSINDILNMEVNDAITFFQEKATKSNAEAKIVAKLTPLQKVGLGYLKLGQPGSTLSGGEAQRVKLAFFLTKGYTDKTTLFVFDEPTTGLHFHDIQKLLTAMNALIEKGHTVLVIEHNQEIIKSADHIIDLGPDGGLQGGEVVFTGTPEEMVATHDGFTARFLKDKLT